MGPNFPVLGYDDLTAAQVQGRLDGLTPAELRKVRDEGVARESSEAQLGLACMAAPVVMNGFAVGAVSVGYPAELPPPGRLEEALKVTTARIVADLDEGLSQGREHWFPREV